MKLHVAYDKIGKIVAAGEIGPKGAGDKPVAQPDISVAEMEVPEEHSGKKLSEYLHRLRVDVGAQKLVSKES
jgi:hypothetical protein